MLNDLKLHLFAAQDLTIFAILDGAMVPDLPALQQDFNPQYVCLFRGTLEPDMQSVAPYLALLERDGPFTDWLLCNGWGKRWGIFGGTSASLISLRTHFRGMVQVRDQQGRLYYFRFYDPAVLRNYLPRCNAQELKEMFGPVQWYWTEEADPRNGRRFSLGDDELDEERITIVQPHERLVEVSWKFEER